MIQMKDQLQTLLDKLYQAKVEDLEKWTLFENDIIGYGEKGLLEFVKS